MKRGSVAARLLSRIARKGMKKIDCTGASRILRSSSSANQALHKLVESGLIEIEPKNLGLKVVTEYVVRQKGLDAAKLALRVAQLKKEVKSTEMNE